MKKFYFIPTLMVILFAAFVSVSIAGYGYHGYHGYHGCNYGMSDMSEMDTNQDNQITFDEFSAPHMDRYRSAFKMLDTDRDGVISKDEWDEFLKVHGFGEPDKS